MNTKVNVKYGDATVCVGLGLRISHVLRGFMRQVGMDVRWFCPPVLNPCAPWMR